MELIPLSQVLADPTQRAVFCMGVTAVALVLLHLSFRYLFPWIARRTETRFDDMAFPLLHRPAWVSAVLLGTWKVMEGSLLLPGALRSIFLTVAVLFWTVALFQVSGLLLMTASQDLEHPGLIRSRTLPLFQMAAKAVIVGLAFYFFFLAWHLDLTAWLASAGVLGIAVGFAAKDSLANLFAGVAIMADAPYRLGDTLRLETGERGQVTEIGLRSTRLLTPESLEIVVPNGVMANTKIVNETGGPGPTHRLSVSVGVAYGSDVEQVRALLEEESAAIDGVLDDPPPMAWFQEMADSALLFEVMVWIPRPDLRLIVIDALNTRIYNRLGKEGITIPFPQQDVYLHRVETG
jgi:small-conductance mechanosensitive channel